MNANTADALYQAAFDELIKIQLCNQIENCVIPAYSEQQLMREMSWFMQWYVEAFLGLTLSQRDRDTFENSCELLCACALSQPVVLVHRDYHSRNLMVLPNQQVGVLDFQDAMWGAVTYDVMSLLKDCYIDWPLEQVWQWLEQFRQQQLAAGILQHDDPLQYRRWFDWMGLQRHLKCFGNFARLKVRDNKPGYLQYIPRLERYALSVCERYPEFAALGEMIQRVGKSL